MPTGGTVFAIYLDAGEGRSFDQHIATEELARHLVSDCWQIKVAEMRRLRTSQGALRIHHPIAAGQIGLV